MKRKRRTEDQNTQGGDGAEAENEEQLLEDEIEFLNEKHRNHVIQEVLDQVRLEHPITYDGCNICEIVTVQSERP